MMKFIRLVAIALLAGLPAQAGVTVSVHAGGGFCAPGFRGGGYCGGYHSFHGGRDCGFYGGGFGYGYAPYYGYASYPIGYNSGGYYDSPVYSAPDAPEATQPSAPAANPAATPTGPLPAGKVDEFGFIHSPYSTTTFKAANVANGQVFYDPTTGQPFLVHVTPAASAPTAPSVVPSATSMPTGKLDEFGYVHSPFSTFTFKVQNGNDAQTFRDPFTGQHFTVSATPATETVASAKVSK